MKLFRKLALVLALAAMLALPASAGAKTAVTSFYPIYMFTLNLTQGLPDIEVVNLAAPGTGCLHDYQLQTGDMKKLAAADAFLINGAGMESFLSNVFEAFPNLPVTDASAGIELLTDDGSVLSVGESESLENAHVWLDASNAIVMVNNLAEGLKAVWPEDADALEANRAAYTERLTALDAELKAGLADLPHKDIITFHEAFPYFAKAYGLNVVGVVNREPGDALSPAQLSSLVSIVKQLGNPPLFIEPQYEDLAARTLSEETGAPVYTLDPAVTGPEDPDEARGYYEQLLRADMAVLQEALGD